MCLKLTRRLIPRVTLLDHLNNEEDNDGGYVPSSQDLFTSQAFRKNPLSHKRSHSLDRSIEPDGIPSKLIKSGDSMVSWCCSSV